MVSSHVDIDECALRISGCKQQCTNTNGSYYCTCRNGFSLQNDNKSCKGINILINTLYIYLCNRY